MAHWATIGVVSGFIMTGTFNTVLALCAFFYVVGYLLSFLSVFALRRKEPDYAAAVPGTRLSRYDAVSWSSDRSMFLVGALVLDWGNSWKSLVLLAVSAPVYLVGRTVGQADGRTVAVQIKANFTAPLTALRMAPIAALSAFSTAMMPRPSMVRSTTRVVFSMDRDQRLGLLLGHLARRHQLRDVHHTSGQPLQLRPGEVLGLGVILSQ